MNESNWQDRSLSLGWLRKQSFDHGEMRNIFDWLKKVGVVPECVKTVRVERVRLDLDPKNIKAGYIAACAFEWDSWGASSPVEFVTAISHETAGSQSRDLIAGLLTMLGREQVAVAA